MHLLPNANCKSACHLGENFVKIDAAGLWKIPKAVAWIACFLISILIFISYISSGEYNVETDSHQVP